MQTKQRLLVAACLMAMGSMAQAQIYKVTLSGANENPPVVTNGTGSAVISVNTTTHELRVKATFSGLNGNTTASHIHCCTLPTANAGVVTATPSFAGFPLGVTAGNFDVTYNSTLAPTWNAATITANGGTPAGAEAAFANGVAIGQAYLNIHSVTSPGGEIRGTLQRFSFVGASSGVTASVAGALDSLGAATGVVNERLVNIAMSGTSAQSSALLDLLPVSGQVVSTLASNTLFSDYDQIGNRLGGLRDAANTTGTGVWIKGGDHDTKHDLNSRNATGDSDGWDVMAGADMVFGPNTVIGAAIGMSEDDVTYDLSMDGSSTNVEGWRITAYGEHTIGTVFLNGMLTWAQNDIETSRNTGAGAAAASGTDGDQWGGRVAAGLRLNASESVLFTPQVRLDWSSFDIDAYTEAGGNGMALNVRSQSEDRLRASIGGQLDFAISSTVKPYVRAFYASEMEDDDTVTAASFVGGGNVFSVTDEGIDSSGYVLGAGLNVLTTQNFGAAISYDRFDGDNYESDFVQAKVYIRF